MRWSLTYAKQFGVYELLVEHGSDRVEFLLEPDEAEAFTGLINELDPYSDALAFADVCALVRSVTGAPPDPPVCP